MKKQLVFLLMLTICIMKASVAFSEEVRRITKDGAPGCTDKDYFGKLIGYVAQGDNAAFTRAYEAGLAIGACTTFNLGEEVYLADVGFGKIKLRRKGALEEYWTVSEAIR